MGKQSRVDRGTGLSPTLVDGPQNAEPGTTSTRVGATKKAAVLSMLAREGGASLVELTVATGWQPHTTRAALTGLRKHGHEIAKDKVAGVTRYSIQGAA